MEVLIYNQDKPDLSPIQARYCASFTCRLRGLTFKKPLPAQKGLLLAQAHENRLDAAIHMVGVWMDLAVVWINTNKEVVDLVLARRWRPLYIPRSPARYVLEVNALHLSDYEIGDRLKFDAQELG